MYKVYENFIDSSGTGTYAFMDCSKITNCKKCADSFGCNWCGTSEKCISDNDNQKICPSETMVTDPLACADYKDSVTDICGNWANHAFNGGYNSFDISGTRGFMDTILHGIKGVFASDDSGSFDSSGNYISGGSTKPKIYAQCSTATSCTSCLNIPDCDWCSNQKICVSAFDTYNKCNNDIILNSIVQCDLKPSLAAEKDISYTTESIIPILGLSRNLDNSLTHSSLDIVLDSLRARGYDVSDPNSKSKVLDNIQKELNYYKNNLKLSVSSYVTNSMDYIADEKSLGQVQNIDTHIQDLKDVSRYIEQQNTSMFKEGFQADFHTINTLYNNEIEKNNTAKINLQIFWLANLAILGSIFLI